MIAQRLFVARITVALCAIMAMSLSSVNSAPAHSTEELLKQGWIWVPGDSDEEFQNKLLAKGYTPLQQRFRRNWFCPPLTCDIDIGRRYENKRFLPVNFASSYGKMLSKIRMRPQT